MGLETEEPDAHSPSSQRQSGWSPSKEMSSAEGDSDGGKKAFEEKGEKLSARSSEKHPQSGESEASSGGRNSRKRKISSRDSGRSTAGSSAREERRASCGKKPKTSAAVHSPEKAGTRDASPRGPQRTRTRRSRPPRPRSPGKHSPPLRKYLVTALRAKSEAVYQDLAQLWARQARSPLTPEQLAELFQLQAPLCALLQTFYAMAAQAAYGFPAQPWLTPASRPGPGDPVRDGDAHGRSPPRRETRSRLPRQEVTKVVSGSQEAGPAPLLPRDSE
ncbi:protein FRG2-like-1 [Nycticebus coucang]|uniref:protein FRG2-like-1 n=1 Tax=Nycticebus coucang TaxID=9470 RepID=UPI00234D9A2F|nr:protein FRG2-like-1 [Nycticebus coucang]